MQSRDYTVPAALCPPCILSVHLCTHLQLKTQCTSSDVSAIETMPLFFKVNTRLPASYLDVLFDWIMQEGQFWTNISPAVKLVTENKTFNPYL